MDNQTVQTTSLPTNLFMEANTYQKLASRTLTERPEKPLDDKQTMLAWNALGLMGEAGEVAEYVKKAVFHGHELDSEVLKKELGDYSVESPEQVG